MRNEEIKKILTEIEAWRVRRFRAGFVSGVVDTVFYPIDRLVDLVIPDSLIDQVVEPVTAMLKGLQQSSRKFSDKNGIFQRARLAGLKVENFRDLSRLPMKDLDLLASGLFERSALLAALQGAGLGAGSYALVLVDFPLLFMINLKLIFEIGSCYGYDPELEREKLFALKVFLIAASTASERESDLQTMEEWIRAFIKGNISYELGIGALGEGLPVLAKKLVKGVVKRKVARGGGLPVIGILLGGGFNYLYTKETAIYAYMYYRKRFLEEKLLKSMSKKEV